MAKHSMWLTVRVSGATQEELAQHMGIPPSTFSRIIRGLRPPPDDFETQLAAAIGAVSAEVA